MIGKTRLHYKIERKLGQGGMGVVYLADDLKLKRKVAIKFLPAFTGAQENERKRFAIEAQAAASLNHPNIATIHAIEETDDLAFIVMEFVDGRELRDVIANVGAKHSRQLISSKRGNVARNASPLHRHLSIPQIINLATQIGEGLRAAHRNGVIHRDIKSANIMVTENNAIKIMDFGLAKVHGEAQITKTGTTMGTAAYMSPEQAQGEPADTRSDLWSFGVVLYELISGRQPFVGEYNHAVVYSIINENPEPLTQLRSDVPLALEAIVRKLLAKDPEERYQEVQEVLDELYTMKPGSGFQSVSAMQPQQVANRNYLPMVIAALVGALLVALIFFGVLNFGGNQNGSSENPRFNSIAVLPFTDLSAAGDQAYFCDGMTEEILTNLSKFQNLKVIARTSVMQYKKTDKSIAQIADELGVETILEGSIRKFKDDIRITAQLINAEDESHIWSDNFDRKFENVFELQEDISKAIAAALQTEMRPQAATATEAIKPVNTDAYEYILKGRYHLYSIYSNNRNPEDFKTAISLFDQALEIDSTYADAYFKKAAGYHWFWVTTGWQDQEALAHSLKYALKGLEYQPNSAYANAIAALAYGPLKKWDDCYQSLLTAFRINPNEYLALHTAAFFYEAHGMIEPAVRAFARNRELSPLVTTAYLLGIDRYLRWGKYEKARKLIGKLETLDAVESPGIAASILERKGWLAMGENRVEDLQQIYSTLDTQYSRFFNEQYRAGFLAYQGKKEEALSLFTNDVIYLLLGMKTEAIDYLKGDFKIYNCDYEILRDAPIYDSLRSEPEFIELLANEKKKYEAYKKQYWEIAEKYINTN